MDRPTWNGVQMCREENDVYLKTVMYTLAYTDGHFSVSYVISDTAMST